MSMFIYLFQIQAGDMWKGVEECALGGGTGMSSRGVVFRRFSVFWNVSPGDYVVLFFEWSF